ncbi:hypothetical protein IQ235_07365 [Oscillatoriales cyanobacterium LEGE 11467]|uniref:DUF4279 domain-containing protein n=1 Tax=Zarconia navalis LEGE 11467 TaxID=1828826 RepID=A0A928Z9B3_9CYAN|nr:hypothetical protein [Zarconia navalis]MBE9040601.1 hypothetical protein [Zarconia navalis LEGE 11467]
MTIERISAIVKFSGKEFLPKKAEEQTGLTFWEKNEPNYVIETGRQKGKLIPHGYASLEAPDEIEDDDKILWLARTLKDKMKIIEECGMEDAVFYIGYFYADQCNCTLTKEELKALADVGINFWFSCYGE